MTVWDFHSHILPKADHGSNSVETSQKQLQLMAAGGTDTVVASSHFYPHEDSVNSFLARRAACAARLWKNMPEDAPRVYLGAEVLVCAGLQHMKDLQRLAVYGTNVILLEMPFHRWSEDLLDTVLAVRAMGMRPVLAHIDRYRKEGVDVLLRQGIKAQLNAELFDHWHVDPYYLRQIDNGAVVALGSDLHGAKKNGYRQFLKMRQKLGERADTVFARTALLLKDAKPLDVWYGEHDLD